MKKTIFNKIKILVALAGILTIGSCESYLDINDDPTQVANPEPEFTLTSGMVDLAYFHSDRYALACNYWCQYVTQAGNVAGFTSYDQYQVTTGDNGYQRDFTGVYSGPLQDLNYTTQAGMDRGNDNIAAVSEVLKAFAFQSLVDMFDQVPYSEALNIDEFNAPKYDDGQAVYDDLIIKIDAAMDMVTTNTPIPVNGDIIFGGDMKKWLAFANTLKLKIYMRQSEARASVAQAGVQSLDGQAFLRTGEDAEVPFDQSNPANRHPAEIIDFNTQSFNAASGTIGNYMLNNNDPRLDVYFRRPVEPVPDDPNEKLPHQFVDQATGNTLGGTTAGLSYYTARGNYLIGTGSAFPFFSAAESKFLQAEAMLRGWLSGSAQDLYEQGIRDSFARTGLSASQADDYISTNAPYPSTGTFDEQLEAIMMEKWVALIRQPIEMWNEWKRTGYPDTDVIAVNPQSYSLLGPGEFPLRFPPIQRELDLNSNAPSVVSLATPVWWDK
ncbi:MAG: SusD/RagB family nutrient-binding outer membrane lipoprotein [Cyclobacteriaceae bacterium]